MAKVIELLELEVLAASKGLTVEITKQANYLFQLQVWENQSLIWDSQYTSIKRACKDITTEINNNFVAWK